MGLSEWQVLGLGAFAGLTIFLGMPVARARGATDRVRAALAAVAVGILLFLFVDVLSNAHGIVASAIAASGGSGVALLDLGALLGGFAFGVVSLLTVEREFGNRVRRAAPPDAKGAGTPLQPLQLSTVIAIGIGLHNLSEGLAIGAAFAAGIPLAIVLVIGFAVHNSTEGFGILAPGLLSGSRYSVRRLAALGLVGGGPTFLGTVLGSSFHSDLLSVLFYGIAAGAILFVVFQMSRPMLAPATREVVFLFIVVGFVLGVVTDFVVTVGGL